MPWLTFKIETVTPCFLAGAYQADEALKSDEALLSDEGLRTASLIGQWRFWLRACLGTGKQYPNWRRREDCLFGSPHDGGSQGKIWVRPGASTKLKVVRRGAKIHDLARRGYLMFEQGRTAIDPLVYLLGQGLYHFSRGLERPAIAAGQTFDVEVAAPRVNVQEAGALWRDFRHALWLWQTFGGLGARSRRGWGSMQIVGVGGLDDVIFDVEERAQWHRWFTELPETPGEDPDEQDETARQRILCRVLDLAFTGREHPGGDEPGSLGRHGGLCQPPCAFTSAETDPESGVAHRREAETPFSHLGSCCAIVRKTTKSLANWESALADAGLAFLEIRSNLKGRPRQPRDLFRVDDHDRVYDLLYPPQTPMSTAPYRAAFGLPHNYFFSREPGRETKKEEFQGPPGRSRRASPVLIHIARARSKPQARFVPYAFWFKSHFLARGDRIVRARGRRSETFEPPDWSAVVAFIHDFYDPGKPQGGRIAAGGTS